MFSLPAAAAAILLVFRQKEKAVARDLLDLQYKFPPGVRRIEIDDRFDYCFVRKTRKY